MKPPQSLRQKLLKMRSSDKEFPKMAVIQRVLQTATWNSKVFFFSYCFVIIFVKIAFLLADLKVIGSRKLRHSFFATGTVEWILYFSNIKTKICQLSVSTGLIFSFWKKKRAKFNRSPFKWFSFTFFIKRNIVFNWKKI